MGSRVVLEDHNPRLLRFIFTALDPNKSIEVVMWELLSLQERQSTKKNCFYLNHIFQLDHSNIQQIFHWMCPTNKTYFQVFSKPFGGNLKIYGVRQLKRYVKLLYLINLCTNLYKRVYTKQGSSPTFLIKLKTSSGLNQVPS